VGASSLAGFRARQDAAEPDAPLEIHRRTRGRVLLIEPDGTVFVGRGYAIARSRDGGASWQRVARVPRPLWRAAAEQTRLTSRLVRQEIRGLAHLSDGTLVAACKSGLFHGPADGGALAPSAIEAHGLPLQWPLRLGVGPGDVVAWGEYVSRRRLRPVRIFASRDRGRTFETVHTLEAGDVLHVHNVTWDASAGNWWVLAGDHGHEPGIGRLAHDFTRFEWLVKGEQRFRAVSVFDCGDRLLYATDTEMEPNSVISLDKRTGASERLFELEGSCLYACRFGDVLAVTTTVEPSEVNHSQDATLWLSRDGERWRCAWRARKDRWHADYFQFGSLVLPAGRSDGGPLWLSGQAVEGLDGVTVAGMPSAELAAGPARDRGAAPD
jgi:hypothetical protein